MRKKHATYVKKMIGNEYVSNLPWWKSYSGAKQRCENPNSHNFKRYGARGIKFEITPEQMNELWLRDKAHLMKKPSIDRIDNDGNYSFENCRFLEGSANTKRRKMDYTPMKIAILQYDINGNFIKRWPSASDVRRAIGLKSNNFNIAEKRGWKVKGYYWRFETKPKKGEILRG